MLARVAFRLTTANAPLCDEQMPATGMVLHTRAQYPQALMADVAAVFGSAAPVSVAIVLPDAPAGRAGILAGDGVEALGGVTLAGADGAPVSSTATALPNTLLRDSIERQLVRLPAKAPISLTVARGEGRFDRMIAPLAACRSRFELVPGASLIARSDGELVQLSARYAAQFSETELAVVVAHELAHTVLRHRRRLRAADVSKGMLSEFGRNGRLNRRAEDEADRFSIHLLRNAGYDPRIAPQFWRQHGAVLGGGLLRRRTHSSPTARARAMEQEIAAIPADAPPVFAPPLLATRDQPFE